MESTNIIAILIFIIPGVLVEKISSKIDMPKARSCGDFGELINGVISSIPIVFITGIILKNKYSLSSLNEIIDKFNDLQFLFAFISWTILFALIFGVVKGIFIDTAVSIINWVREKLFKRIKTDDKSCWRKMFLDIKKAKYLEVNINGNVERGMLKCCSLPNEPREIVIYTPKEWEPYPNEHFDNDFTRVSSTYIDIEKNVIIKDYDMDQYLRHIDDMIKDANRTTLP